jgi:hypothetical protein
LVVFSEIGVGENEARRIRELADGMTAGDRRAMEAFFTFIRGLRAKKLGKDGEGALAVVVSVVELLLPTHVRLGYAAASDKENKKKARPRKRVAKKKRSTTRA